ncbi:hypothetical protein CNR22_10720 [Sphingobacteriaceae bacterium]|nr:hypothetical protein CNR22_10720 [Sphingobacteriaceae bacterium]
MIAIFASPYTKSKTKLNYYAEWYVYPYFSQNWNLFAPTPDTNYKLFVEYEDKGKQKTDLFQEILVKHQTNRLKGYGPLVLAFSNTIHYFEKSTELQNKLNGPIKEDKYFSILEKSVLNYLRATRKTDLKKVKIQLLVQALDSKEMKVYYN